MNRPATKAAALATAGLLVLAAQAAAQSVPADTLLLPASTPQFKGFVFLASEPFLHAWDTNATGGQPSENTFLGRQTGNVLNLLSNKGRFNTGIGSEALHEITTGWNNTAVGRVALRWLSSGSSNTAVGSSALASCTTGDLNSAFGAGSLVANTTGSYNAAFAGLPYNTTGSYNTAVGQNSLFSSISGWGNTAVGYNSLLTSQNSLNTALGYQADVGSSGLVNATAIGANARATASNMVRIGSTAVTVIQGQVPFSWVSDRRWKKDIATLELGLQLVRQLRPVSYRLQNGNDRLDMGFVAQEVEAVLGGGYNAVSTGNDEQHLLSMRYTDLIAPLVRAVQELDQQRGAAEAELALLRRENAAMRADLDHMRGQLASGRTQDRARIELVERALQAVMASLEGGGARQLAANRP